MDRPKDPVAPEAVPDSVSNAVPSPGASAGLPWRSAAPILVQVPGRVNLIGEHTDYNGLPVLPAAIAQSVRFEVWPAGDARVQLRNSQPSFGTREFPLSDRIAPFPPGDWGNYAKAAVQGLVRHLKAKTPPVEVPHGFHALVRSDLPMAAGLSSSSCIVIATALALLAANGIDLQRLELAELLAGAEHYVGTQGGGMDHAAILLAEAGHALRIDFFPLRVQPVPLFAGHRLVVCRSMVDAPKTREARLGYNRRPMECRLVHAILSHELRQRGYATGSQRTGDLVWKVPDLLPWGKKILGQETWRLSRVEAVLGLPAGEVSRRFLTLTDGSVFPEPPDGFLLGPRFRHVVLEAARVDEAVIALKAGDAARFGRLMDESHSSCRDLYQISCPELDMLVETARRAGAMGARLTGAGFGGCTVSLVAEGDLERFRSLVWKRYYDDYLAQIRPEARATLSGPEDAIFVVEARGGAMVTGLARGGFGV